ncbi:MAG: SDR family NAD(P)-dependent oxidoreductase [Vicinamibacterales bacterium]
MTVPRHPPDVVLVSGATSGIGRACALDLHARGFTVLAGGRDAAALAQLAALDSPRLTPIHLDVIDPVAIALAADRAEALSGGRGLAGLVHAAGVAEIGPLETQSIDALRRMLDVNVVGVSALTQRCLPAIRRRRGRVVLLGSIAGRSALPFMGAYSASKHALEALADALRVELLPWGVQVAIVEAGAVDTPIGGRALASIDDVATRGPAASLYREALAAFRRAVEASMASALPPASVAEAVAHALTSRRPRTRYVVGWEAWQRLLLKHLLSDRWHDRAVRRVVGLPSRPPGGA